MALTKLKERLQWVLDSLSAVREFIRDATVYGIGSGIERVLRLALVPIYIAGLSVAEFGAFGLLETFLNIAIWVIGGGLHSAIVRFGERSEPNARQYMMTGFVVTAGLGIVGTLLLLVMSNSRLVLGLIGETGYNRPLRIGLLLLPAMMITTAVQGTWRIQRKSILLASYGILITLIELGGAIVLIVLWKRGLEGLLLARLISVWLAAIVGLAYYLRRFRLTDVDLRFLRPMLRYGLPLIPHRIALELNNGAARFVLQYFLGLPAVGLYTVAEKVAGTVSQLSAPVADAYEAFVYNNAEKENAQSLLRKASILFIAGIACAGLLIQYASPMLLSSFDREGVYTGALAIVGLLVLGAVFNGFYRVASFGIFLSKKTKLLPLITGASAMINVAVCFALIPRLGVSGAAIAAALSLFVKFVISYRVTARLYPIRLFTAFALAGGVLLLVVLLDLLA